jgi:hypothetical protein
MRTEKAEEKPMKRSSRLKLNRLPAVVIFAITLIATFVVLLTPQRASAFSGSDEERYKAQIEAARRRGKEFRAYRDSVLKADAEREAAAGAAKAAREADERRAEEAREAYAAERPEREKRMKMWEELERADEKARMEEEKKQEVLERSYARFKDRVHQILESEGSLTEAEELNAYSRVNPHGEKLPLHPDEKSGKN